MATTKVNDQSIVKIDKKEKEIVKDYMQYISVTDEQLQKIRKRKEELRQDFEPIFWEEPIAKIHWVPVEDGEIRVVHVKPKNPISKRPIVFISGWQSMPYQFTEMYKIIHNRTEIYFVETREKYTSKIKKRRSDFSLTQKAIDVQTAIKYFNLQDKDFVLFGSCWGAATIYQGLLDGNLKAPTYVTFSPMHKLWFNKFLLKYIVPILPGCVVGLLMKLLSGLIFHGEKAETQKNRMQLTIKEGVGWKWRKSALAAKKFELFGKLSAIQEEVLVISGTHDRVHKAYDYPRFADELPNGRFFHFGIEEHEREIVMGVLMYELSLITSQETPEIFTVFEREIE